jgi:hypothetical protein
MFQAFFLKMWWILDIGKVTVLNFKNSEVWKSLENWIEAGPHLSATRRRVTSRTGCQPPRAWHHSWWVTGDRTLPVAAASTVFPSSPYPLLEPHAEPKISFASSPTNSLEHPLSPGRSHSARPLPSPCKPLCAAESRVHVPSSSYAHVATKQESHLELPSAVWRSKTSLHHPLHPPWRCHRCWPSSATDHLH